FNTNDIWAPVDYAPGRPRPSGFLAKQATASLRGKRLGVINTYVGVAYPPPFPSGSTSNTTGNNSISTEILSIFNRARSELEGLGASIYDVYLPPDVDTSVSLGAGQPTRALVTPTQNATNVAAYYYAAFLVGLGQDPVTRLLEVPGGRVSTAQITAVQNGTGISFSSPQGVEHFQAQALYVAKFEAFMNGNGFDALIWPTHTTKTRTTANPPGRDLVNNMGHPLCTVPMGVIPSTGEPSTLAFLGKYRSEADILALAHAYEVATNYRIPSPLTPAIDGESFTYTVSTPPAGSGAVAAPSLASTSEENNVQIAIPPSLRLDKKPPVVAIAGRIERHSGEAPQVLFSGIAADRSGLQSLNVYVNGIEIPTDALRRWKAAIPLEDLKKAMVTKSRRVDVLVLAKDNYGNASATEKKIAIPGLR
ncbi:MAG TPA: hypothetical protein VGH90_02915, partial [Chthoniobacteraceae bacterium]